MKTLSAWSFGDGFVALLASRFAGIKTARKLALDLDKSGIHVAELLTVVPAREVLQAKLQQSITTARQRLLGDAT